MQSNRKYSSFSFGSHEASVVGERRTLRESKANLSKQSLTSLTSLATTSFTSHSHISLGSSINLDDRAGRNYETLSLYNGYLRLFNVLVSILSYVTCFYVSAIMFFHVSKDDTIILVNDIVFAIAVYLKLRTGYVHRGVEERDYLKVLYHHLDSFEMWLYMLSFCHVPYSMYHWVYSHQAKTTILMTVQIQLFRVAFMQKRLEAEEHELGSNSLLYRNLRYFSLSFLIVHLIAVVFYYMACNPMEAHDTVIKLDRCLSKAWIFREPEKADDTKFVGIDSYLGAMHPEEDDLLSVYVLLIYFASATATAVGYGDIIPNTKNEKFFVAFSLAIAFAVLNALAVGSMTSMWVQSIADRTYFLSRYNSMVDYLQYYEIPKNLADKCTYYMEYNWNRFSGHNIYQNGVFDVLPQNHKVTFLHNVVQPLLKQVAIFKSLPEFILRDIAVLVQFETHLDGHYIHRRGEQACNVYYIHKGALQVLDKNNKEVLAIMLEGKVFGELSLLINKPVLFSVRCQTICEVFYLNKFHLLKYLKRSPKAYRLITEQAELLCGHESNQWSIIKLGNTPFHHGSLNHHASTINNEESDILDLTTIGTDFQCYSGTDLLDEVRDLKVRDLKVLKSDEYQPIPVQFLPILVTNDRSLLQQYKYITELHIPKVIFIEPPGPDHKNLAEKSKNLVSIFEEVQLIKSMRDVEEVKDVHDRDYRAVKTKVSDKDTDTEVEEEKTRFEKFMERTHVSPQGRFNYYWQIYIILVTFLLAMYVIYDICHRASPVAPTTIVGEEIENIDLYDILEDEEHCGMYSAETVRTICGHPESNIKLLDCITASEQPYESIISKHRTTNEYMITTHKDYKKTINPEGSYLDFMPQYVGLRHDTLIFLVICDLSIYLALILTFKTAVYTPNGISFSYVDILLDYARPSKMGLDLIGYFPLKTILTYSYAQSVYCRNLDKCQMVSFGRINEVLLFIRYAAPGFKTIRRSFRSNQMCLDMVRGFSYAAMITHACGCMFFSVSCGYYVPDYQQRVDAAWLCSTYSHHNLVNASKYVDDKTIRVFMTWEVRSYVDDYIAFIYWSISTLTTTGLGDIVAFTVRARVIAVLTMFSGLVMFGWLVGVCSAYMTDYNSRRIKFFEDLKAAIKFLEVQGIPKELIQKVKDMRTIEFELSMGSALPTGGPLEENLSEELKTALAHEKYSAYLHNIPFLKDVNPKLIMLLCGHIQTSIFTGGDSITDVGILNENKIFVVKHGHCFALTGDYGETFRHFGPGSYFGDVEMLFGLKPPRRIMAMTFCELHWISANDFWSTVELFSTTCAELISLSRNETYKLTIQQGITSDAKVFKDRHVVQDKFDIMQLPGGSTVFIKKPVIRNLIYNIAKESKFPIFFKPFPATFDPYSKPYILYESIRIIALIVQFFVAPLMFSHAPKHPFVFYLYLALDMISVFDIVIKSHTICFRQETLVIPEETMKHYFKTSFFIDFVTSFPFNILALSFFTEILSAQREMFWNLLVILKLLAMPKIFQFRNFLHSTIQQKTQRKLTVAFRIIIIALLHHWMACFLFLVVCPPFSSELVQTQGSIFNITFLTYDNAHLMCVDESWMVRSHQRKVFPQLELSTIPFDRYILSFYWASVLLVGVGYGDINDTEMIGRGVTAFVMFVGWIFYALLIGVLASNITLQDASNNIKDARMGSMRKFLDDYNISRNLNAQVMNFYKMLWFRTGGRSIDRIFAGLSCSLTSNIKECMFGPLIKNVYGKNFKQNTDTAKFWKLMYPKMKITFFPKGSIICSSHDYLETVYLIRRGCAEAVDKKYREEEGSTKGDIGKLFEPGDFIGQEGMLKPERNAYTVYAYTNCDLAEWSVEVVRDILSDYPELKKVVTGLQKNCKGGKCTVTESIHSMNSFAEKQDEKKTVDTTKKPWYNHLVNFNTSKQKQRERRKFDNLLNCTKDADKVYNSNPKLLLVLDIANINMATLSCFLVTYMAAFNSQNRILHIMGAICDIWFFVDMWVSLNTAYISQFGTMVQNLKSIRLRYRQRSDKFLLDAVANVPLEILSVFTMNHPLPFHYHIICVLRLNRVFRIIRIQRCFGKLLKKADFYRYRTNIVSFFKFAFDLFILTHFFACGFHAITMFHYLDKKAHTMISASEWTHSHWFHHPFIGYETSATMDSSYTRYVDCFYWTIITVTTLGYGDVKPKSRVELVYASLTMIVGKIFLGYKIGTLAGQISNSRSLRNWFQGELRAVKTYMQDHGFSPESYNRFLYYYNYIFLRHDAKDVMDLFPELPSSIKSRLYGEILGNLLNEVRIFEGCSRSFINFICTKLIVHAYVPGDLIASEGEKVLGMYMVAKGTIDVLKVETKIPISVKKLTQNQIIFMEEMLQHSVSPFRLKAQTFVDVSILTAKTMQQAVEKYPDHHHVVSYNMQKYYNV